MMKDIVEVKIKDSLNSSLEMNSAASSFFDYINNFSEDVIKINFADVIFISRSFAQEYIHQKIKTKKIIEEFNLSEDVAPILEIVENSFKNAET